MALKQTIPTTGGDYVQFGNATTPVAAQIGGYEDSTGNGHLELYCTSGGTSTERMRIDSNGNVGIGVTPNAWAGAFKAIQLGAQASLVYSSGTATYLSQNWVNDGADKYIGTGPATMYYQYQGGHVWQSAASGSAGGALTFTERMRIDSSGNVIIGGSSNPNGTMFNINGGGTYYGMTSIVQGTASIGHIYFRNANGNVGLISTSGTTTTYATSSDYRLKENVAPMTGALETVAQLKPVTYIWKADGSEGQGFIAHELQAVVPDCVTGEKDAVDADGNPVYQGIDTSFLVATLTAAIQEQQELIKQLQADVAALKGA